MSMRYGNILRVDGCNFIRRTSGGSAAGASTVTKMMMTVKRRSRKKGSENVVYALKDFKPAQISLSLVVVGETSAIEKR